MGIGSFVVPEADGGPNSVSSAVTADVGGAGSVDWGSG